MILLLAGTGEARALAKLLAAADMPAIASLAGAVRDPRPIAIPTRIGGFGGVEGFETFLEEGEITAVIDATHPFAARITHRSAKICAEKGIPYLQILRPEWTPNPGDNWHMIANEAQATDLIPKTATVFLATGRQTLGRFEGLAGRRMYCRQIDPPRKPFPFEIGEYVIRTPPFSVEDEIALFRKLAIDWLVVKNAGGNNSRSKLDAARTLGLNVAMIERPAQPQCAKVETAKEAMEWAKRLSDGS